MIPSIILNALIVIIVAGCIVWGVRRADPPSKLFRYFTTLSNVLAALSSIAVLTQAGGPLPLWAVIFKYTGTAAVTVTMLTVLFFLGPVTHDWKSLLGGAELFLHLICPLMALVSFIGFENAPMPAWVIAIGTLPVILYGALYCKKVVFSSGERRWEDFYGFNRNGKWLPSCLIMVAGAALIAFALWAI